MPNTLISTEKVTYLFADPGSRTALVLGVVSTLAFLYFFISTIRLIALRKKQKKELRAVSDDIRIAKKKARGEKVIKKEERKKAKKEKHSSKKNRQKQVPAEQAPAPAAEKQNGEQPAEAARIDTSAPEPETKEETSAFTESEEPGTKEETADKQKGEM